ncbi:MAG: T9SS type A sorting domain-containing protein [Flavobacteriales bacterium]|nr:T9SS type A sorting domain-containing protein [Flavobacteriales bacterium]
MKKTLRALAIVPLAAALGVNAQRYATEVFTDAQLTITPDVPFGQNVDFLTSDLSNPAVFVPEVQMLQGMVSNGDPIPLAFFNPADTSTAVKVANLQMDVYEPSQATDCEQNRALFIFVHTGNALPPPLNGSPNGTRKDSSAVEVCKRMARRGYVAVSMSYRLGWNPLGATLEIRRGTLLNAIYRAIHDVKQCIRNAKANADDWNIDPSKVILYGEGTGGYISVATATLDNAPEELYIEKFLPNPFDPTISYVDSTTVGNIEGYGGLFCLYRPNGESSDFNFCVNAGGALADTSWLAPGDVPMVAFHTVFDPFAPFTEGIVIVPTTGEQVVPVQGSNLFIQLANTYGNNAAFASFPDGDLYTDRARDLYGSTQVHAGSSVTINTGVEGLYPLVTTDWPGLGIAPFEEASPWQWWDPNSPLAQVEVQPGVTTNQASLASNPNSSPEKGRAVIDTIIGYMNPRIIAALSLSDELIAEGSPCDDGNANTVNDTYLAGCICEGSPIGIAEVELSNGLSVQPNPAHDVLRVVSEKETMVSYELHDATGRRVRNTGVNARQFTMDRTGLQPGAYFLTVRFAHGSVTRKVALD